MLAVSVAAPLAGIALPPELPSCANRKAGYVSDHQPASPP